MKWPNNLDNEMGNDDIRLRKKGNKMPSMSKTIKELDRIVSVFSDALKLLTEQEEQKQKVLDLIEKEQDCVSDFMHSRTEYEQGKFDGLNVAYAIVEDEWKASE